MYVHIYIYIHIYMCIYIYIYIYIYKLMNIDICKYKNIYVYVYNICVYVIVQELINNCIKNNWILIRISLYNILFIWFTSKIILTSSIGRRVNFICLLPYQLYSVYLKVKFCSFVYAWLKSYLYIKCFIALYIWKSISVKQIFFTVLSVKITQFKKN